MKNFENCQQCNRSLDTAWTGEYRAVGDGLTCVYCLGLNETCCDRAVKAAVNELALMYLSASQAGSGDVTPAPEALPPCVTP